MIIVRCCQGRQKRKDDTNMANIITPNIVTKSSRGLQPIRLQDKLFTENRIIYFNEPVDSTTAAELNVSLLALDAISHEEIKLILNTPGGEVSSGLSIYDMIRNVIKSPVTAICAGDAASMGFIIFLAADKRLMLQDSRLMLHDPALGGGSLAGIKPLELKTDILDRLLKVRDQIGNIISERSGLPLDEIFAMTEKDTFLSAEESLEKGFATGIIKSPEDIELV